MDPYDAIDWLYDLEHQKFEDDLELILGVAETVEGPILELGCGSGRVLLPLSARGNAVTGLDSSSAMLQRARVHRNAQAGYDEATKAALVPGDMVRIDEAVSGPFSLAIYSLNGFMHLPTQADQIASLRSLHRVLDQGGLVLFDLMNPAPDYLEQINQVTVLEWQDQPGEGRTVQKWAHRVVDPVDQVISTTIWYDLTESDGGLKRVHTQFDLRYVHFAELRLMLELTGYGDVTAYGSYALDSYDGHSDRLIVIAEKSP